MRPSTSVGWYVLSIIVLESGGAVQSPPPPMLSTPSPAPVPARSRTTRAIASLALASFASQAAGGVIGDYFGWRTVFFVLAAMLAAAAVALAYELATNPITRTDRKAPKGRSLLTDYEAVLFNPWARIMLLAIGLEGALFQG